MQILEILKYVEENENSAFFYTPNINEGGKSYLFKTPYKILCGKSEQDVNNVFAEVDELSQDPNLIGFATVPYEIGYYFQPKEIKNSYLNKNELRFVFYKKDDVQIIDSGNLEFENVEDHILAKPSIKNMKLDISKEEYVEKINKIKNYIAAGDTYQINFTTKVKFDFDGELTSLFLNGIFNQSASYSVLINNENEFILSFSPELFFQTDYNKIITKPMKGTLKRKANPEKDKYLPEFLSEDEKNLAENVMIVDLMRNDIGRIAETDSVKVEKLYEVEKYETLYQLTSTVSGKLKENKLSEIFKNLFPSGSITGAPKIRSMRIIAELEKSPRDLYTGSIGLISSDKAVFNIPIRTINIDKRTNKGEMGLGSGIVWDSDAESEYKEVLLKGKFISEPQTYFELLETMLFEHGQTFLFDYHMNRLRDSANYFLFKFDEKKVVEEIIRISENCEADKKYKIRILLNKWSGCRIEASEIENSAQNINVIIKEATKREFDKFYYHKTTNREWDKFLYEANENGYDEVIFINERGELLEGAISNVIIEKSRKYFTPPSELGILNGCYRQFLLDNKKCEEKVLKIGDLKCADKIILCNSVREEITVSRIYGWNGKLILK